MIGNSSRTEGLKRVVRFELAAWGMKNVCHSG